MSCFLLIALTNPHTGKTRLRREQRISRNHIWEKTSVRQSQKRPWTSRSVWWCMFGWD